MNLNVQFITGLLSGWNEIDVKMANLHVELRPLPVMPLTWLDLHVAAVKKPMKSLLTAVALPAMPVD